MKKFILLYFCFLQFVIFAQQPDDDQWYITHDGYIDGASWMPIYNSFTTVDIFNASYPDLAVEDDSGDIGKARNHFFVIYEDGMHYNSRYSNTSHAQQNMTNYINYVPQVDVGYRILNSTPSNIEYLYHSNIYEEDDAEESIVVEGNPGTGSSYLQEYMIDYTTPPSIITANHNVVKDKDITLIFDLDRMKRNKCDSVGYDLCFDIKGYSPKQKPGFTYDDVDLSPVFDGQSTIGMTIGTLSGNCLSIDHFDYSKPYAYLNLYMPLSIADYKGEKLTFTLRSSNGKCIEIHPEEIRDSHDPNFIEVMCVSRKCGYNIVKYHVECENESTTPAGDLSIQLTLPYDFVGLNITDHSINNGNGTQGEVSDDPNTSNNNVNFMFSQPLGRINMKAYVEFCVRYLNVPPDFNLVTSSLQPTIPRTSFNNTLYAIENYIDIAQDSIIEEKGEEGTVIYTTILERPLTGLCDCEYTYPTPCKEIATPMIRDTFIRPGMLDTIKTSTLPRKQRD